MRETRERSRFRRALGKLNDAGFIVTCLRKAAYLIEPVGKSDYKGVYDDPEIKALIQFKEASANDVIGLAAKVEKLSAKYF